MGFHYWTEAIILIFMFLVIIAIPCVGVAMMGTKLINELGQYPSRAPVIHMSVLFQLIVLEIISYTLLLVFFHIFENSV